MEQNRSEFLTQDGLIAELHKLGYIDVTKRRIASWRAKDLMPSFDMIGGGRGQRRGRESSVWAHREEVINQAAWVYELLKIYKGFDDIYLPLWMLGYPVPLARVRHALSEPLNWMVHSIESEIGRKSELEDAIGQAAYEFTKDMKRAKIALFQVPQDAIDTLTNLFFNSDYDLKDVPFQDGVEALQKWEWEFHQMCESIFDDGTVNRDECTASPDDGVKAAFMHAEFINEFFSLPLLKAAVDESTDDDLVAVWNDMHVMRESVLLFKRAIMPLLSYIPEEMNPTTLESLATIFRFGKMCIWADLSLRWSGYGDIIDFSLPTLLSQLREEIDEELEQELSAVSPEIAVAVETCFDRLMAASALPGDRPAIRVSDTC